MCGGRRHKTNYVQSTSSCHNVDAKAHIVYNIHGRGVEDKDKRDMYQPGPTHPGHKRARQEVVLLFAKKGSWCACRPDEEGRQNNNDTTMRQ